MKHTLFTSFLLTICLSAFSVDNQIVWDINSLTSIGGYVVTKTGSPTVKTIDGKQAVEFNSATSDRIQIAGNPLGSAATNFTVEIIFKPYSMTTSDQPRFFHLCKPSEASNATQTMTLETRYSTTNAWYGDFFVKSVNGSGFINSSKTYATDQWAHIAMVYSSGSLKGYINGVEQISGTGTYTGVPEGAEVSLGGRMNNKNYLSGAIAKVIFTKSALSPSEFTYDNVVPTDVKTILKDNNGYSFAINNSFIAYSIPQTESVQINVYNLMGKKIKSLLNNKINSGEYEISSEKENLPTGIYLYTIQTSGGFRSSQKVLVK